MPAKDVTAELLYDELGEKWRTMIDTPERILSDMRNAYDWAMRQEMIPVMMNPAPCSRREARRYAVPRSSRGRP